MRKLFLAVVILALSLGTIAADVVPTAVLNIKNRSSDVADFTFYAVDVDLNEVATDPSLYALLDPQSNKLFELEAGTYQIVTNACGETKTYQEEVAGRWNLTVSACPKWAKVNHGLDNGLKLGLEK